MEEIYMIKKRKTATMMALFFVVTLVCLSAGVASAQEENEATEEHVPLVILGCALAITIAGISAATGLAFSGSSAVAATAEKPELFGKLLVLQVLPMTQAVYGLLTAILLMMGVGLLGGTPKATMLQGMGA